MRFKVWWYIVFVTTYQQWPLSLLASLSHSSLLALLDYDQVVKGLQYPFPIVHCTLGFSDYAILRVGRVSSERGARL